MWVGGESRQTRRFKNYTEAFEELCPIFMSNGLSYEDFWDGDVEKAKYIRLAALENEKRKNRDMWIQGRYFYEAVIAAYPVLNALSKKKEPLPYLTEPIPVTEAEAKELIEKKAQEKLEADREKFIRQVKEFNKQFKKRSDDNGS